MSFSMNVKLKYGEKAKLCYMYTDSFIVYIKIDDIYQDIAENLETRLDTSNYELDSLLPKGKNKKVFGLMKDQLGGGKTYSYLTNHGSENKKAKGTKKCVIKRKVKFENYRNCLEATKLENKINYIEKKINMYNLKKP